MDTFRKNPAHVPNVISRIHQLSEEFLKGELEKAGLTGMVASHGHILGCLFMEDKLPMWRIVSLIKRRKSTLTVLADKLEQEGYIRREASPTDSRVRHLALTPKAEGIRPVFMDITTRLQARFWNGFSPNEQKQFMDYLLRMENNFRADTDEELTNAEPEEAASAGHFRS